MDIILNIADHYLLDDLYAKLLPYPSIPSALEYLNSTTIPTPYAASQTYGLPAALPAGAKAISALPRDSMLRQAISLFFIAWIGSAALYFLFSSLSYYAFFDRRLEHHPKFLKNQIAMEIRSSMIAMPSIDILTLPIFLAEVRSKSLLYTDVAEYGWAWMAVSTLAYLVFNDVAIYWIHRLEHHPSIYKYVHKPHHKWVIPTPWAALAFHPVDGFAQSLPYHIFVFICPMHKTLYMALFVLVQLWTVFIHDSSLVQDSVLEKYHINSPGHHTLHHLLFKDNLGQYLTFADKFWGTHREPEPHLDPIHEAIRVMQSKGLADAEGNVIPQKGKKDL